MTHENIQEPTQKVDIVPENIEHDSMQFVDETIDEYIMTFVRGAYPKSYCGGAEGQKNNE